MAVKFSMGNGVYINHEEYISRNYSSIDLKRQMFPALFDIWEPFLMDTEFERKSIEQSDRKKSLKRKGKRSQYTSCSDNDFLQAQLAPVIDGIVAKAKELGFLCDEVHKRTNNAAARVAARLAIKSPRTLSNACTDWAGKLKWKGATTISCKKGIDSIRAALGSPLHHLCKTPCSVQVGDENFVLPPDTVVCISDLKDVRGLVGDQKYDVILMDPPWENRSVKRQRTYDWVDTWQLQNLPIDKLCHGSTFVLVWVTNSSRMQDYVKNFLFPYWKLQHVATWYWVKVTKTGELVRPLDCQYKRPYEILLIGRVKETVKADPPTKVSTSSFKTDNESATFQSTDGSSKFSAVYRDNTPLEMDLAPQLNNHVETGHASRLDSPTEREHASQLDHPIEKDHALKLDSPQESGHSARRCDRWSRSDVNNPTTHGSEASSPRNCDDSSTRHTELPDNYVIVSVPCALHSHKPPISDVLSQLLPSGYSGLELFARAAVPGWTVWGNEPLQCSRTSLFIETKS